MFECIIKALKQFRADAGSLSKQFRYDYDQKLLGGNTCRWVYCAESKIIGFPSGHQSANGLAERAWATVCAMTQSYMTKKQMPQDYWFHTIQHLVRMTKQIPVKLDGKLTTPFEIFHHVAPDTCTWFPLFSIAYFYKDSYNYKDCTTF